MDKATFLEMMDQYIAGTMSSAEKYEFEQMLQKDPLLQDELNKHKLIRKGINLTGRKDLLNELNEIKSELNQTNTINIRSLHSKWYLMIAAVVIFIFGAIFLVNNETIIKSEPQYVGRFDMKILPLEGKMGGPSSEKIHVLLKANDANVYEIKNDTLLIYAKPGILDSILLMDSNITLNQNRHILIEVKQKKYIFTLKK